MVTAYARFFENQADVRAERMSLALVKHTEELRRLVKAWDEGKGLDVSTLTNTILQASADMNAILFETHAGAVFAAVDVYLESKGMAAEDTLTSKGIEKALRRAVVSGGKIN